MVVSVDPIRRIFMKEYLFSINRVQKEQYAPFWKVCFLVVVCFQKTIEYERIEIEKTTLFYQINLMEENNGRDWLYSTEGISNLRSIPFIMKISGKRTVIRHHSGKRKHRRSNSSRWRRRISQVFYRGTGIYFTCLFLYFYTIIFSWRCG